MVCHTCNDDETSLQKIVSDAQSVVMERVSDSEIMVHAFCACRNKEQKARVVRCGFDYEWCEAWIIAHRGKSGAASVKVTRRKKAAADRSEAGHEKRLKAATVMAV